MSNSRNPSTWDDYERGSPARTSSNDSLARGSVQWEEESLLGRSVGDNYANQQPQDGEWPALRRRRSSVTNRLAALTEIGGVNSIRSFTRSWQRAAGFAEVIPQRPAFIFAPDQAPIGAPEGPDDGQERPEQPPAQHAGYLTVGGGPAGPRASLLRQHLEASYSSQSPLDVEEAAAVEEAGEGSPEPGASSPVLPRLQSDEQQRRTSGTAPTDYREREAKALESELSQAFFRVGSHSETTGRSGRSPSIFAVPPHLATPPIIGSYGSFRGSIGGGAGADYGTMRDATTREGMEAAGALWRQQQEAGGNVPDGEVEPILVKEVEQDGKIVLTVEGQSTLPQTVFNSINVLIGVGLLSLPMGIKYAGWLCGMVALFLAAAVTAWTARLLAKCMNLDPSLITFSDLAYISFGARARFATSVLFTLELLAACVALFVLFADSLDLLLPGFLSVTEWKVLCAIIMIPLNFLPLRLLSFTSIIGILCCFGILLIMLIDGFLKPTSPGSLIEPAATYMFPANWLTLPLSFGLLMSPWGGHSVFPNIYRDMRHPYKYTKAVKITFSFTYLLDVTTAVAGLLMFGDDVRDEITSNILTMSAYPRALTVLLCTLIAIIPLTKIPLNARPILSTAEVLLGLHQQVVSDAPVMVGRSMYFRGLMKAAVRVIIIIVFLIISILFPAFDTIMAFMGSALCFTICVTLPLAFYLKLFGDDISAREKLLAYTTMTISIILSAIGTVWAFLPKSLIGAE